MRQRSRKHLLQKRIQRRRPKLRLKRYRQGSVGAQRESSETSKEGTVELWRLRPTRMKRIIMRKQEEGQEINDVADVMETAKNTSRSQFWLFICASRIPDVISHNRSRSQ